MYRIAVCDDSPFIRQQIAEIIQALAASTETQLEQYSYENGEQLLASLRDGQRVDLLFLDIEMQLLNGVAVGGCIREELDNQAMQIVYISGCAGYERALFAARPMNFIAKPFTSGQIIHEVEKGIRLRGCNTHVFTGVLGQTIFHLPYHTIRYFCSGNRSITVYLQDGQKTFYGRLEEIEKRVEDGSFIRIHKSFLVNYAYVARLEYESVTLTDGMKLSISRPYQKVVRTMMRVRLEKAE